MEIKGRGGEEDRERDSGREQNIQRDENENQTILIILPLLISLLPVASYYELASSNVSNLSGKTVLQRLGYKTQKKL